MEKFTKSLLLTACSIMLFTTTSCLNEDDDSFTNVLTAEEAASYLREMNGTAQGKSIMLYYAKDRLGRDSLAKDSVMTTVVTINGADSTATMTFPMRLVAHNIENNEALKEAVSKMGEQPLRAKLVPYRAEKEEKVLGFYFAPTEGITTEVTYEDGEKHELSLTFNGSSYIEYYTYTSIGGYVPSTRDLSFYLFPYTLNIDEKNKVQLRGNAMLFVGSKQ